jgi:hypothetical protein
MEVRYLHHLLPAGYQIADDLVTQAIRGLQAPVLLM